MTNNFEAFLRVAEDGRIWWLRKDAIRLGAGFLPVCDDNLPLHEELHAPNKHALATERSLIGALSDARLTIPQPTTFERDGFRYVDAAEFLEWLSQYIAQTQAKITCPKKLAGLVQMALAKAAVEPPQAAQIFESMTLALEGWFDRKRLDLPDALRQRVEFEFFPVPWDDLSADQRRSAALQLDYQHDPATELDRKKWWDFLDRKYDLEKQILHWDSVACPTAAELALKEDRLRGMHEELARMKQRFRSARGDYYPELKRQDSEVGAPAIEQGFPIRYIAYPKAMKALADRLRATPEEIAAWVWMGHKENGLAAYLNANELDPPPRFYYDIGNGDNFDYLAPLMACWFREGDIAQFQPADRYITGKILIESWSKRLGIQSEAFIRAKIAESRLSDIHPIYGGTQGNFPDELSYPPVTIGIFAVREIEAIEAEDFGVDKEIDESDSGSCQSASADLIRQNFPVIRDIDANERWWKEKMADAERYGLLGCRVGKGKKGRGAGSLWRPDMIAGWLVDRHTKGKEGLPVDVARSGLKKFIGCEDIAEQVFPQDE